MGEGAQSNSTGLCSRKPFLAVIEEDVMKEEDQRQHIACLEASALATEIRQHPKIRKSQGIDFHIDFLEENAASSRLSS